MKRSAVTIAVCAGLLAACSSGSVKDTLGLARQAPDEFRVVTRPPLSVPPQFSLRPPDITGQSPGVLPADQQAKSMMLGTEPTASPQGNVFFLKPGDAESAVAPVAATPSNLPSGSAAEVELLKKAGADRASPGVRQQLIEEKVNLQVEEEESAWWDILSTNPPKKDPMVDARKEAERINKNEEEGKPVTEGETPEVKGRDTGVLGRILGY